MNYVGSSGLCKKRETDAKRTFPQNNELLVLYDKSLIKVEVNIFDINNPPQSYNISKAFDCILMDTCNPMFYQILRYFVFFKLQFTCIFIKVWYIEKRDFMRKNEEITIFRHV